LGISEDIKVSLNVIEQDLVVNCDANQIQQVLMNMMNNARDAVLDSKEKCIEVELNICQPDDDFFNRNADLAVGRYVRLNIADTGYGMDDETKEKIFDPFFTTKEVGSGTGLGLSSAFGSIESHHGVIEVESELGRGTTFSVYLPLIEVAKTNAANHEDQSIELSSKHETILLVDDDPLIVESTQEVLEELGYKVKTAMDGVEGLECFKAHQDEIVAVITDVVMPEMGGVEMFRQIRQLRNAIPTLFVTGYDQSNMQLKDDEKINTYIQSKPIQISEFSRLVRDIVKSNV
ncbi:MAG: ATP-binding protein, partial [Mariprofundaceae bacterium]